MHPIGRRGFLKMSLVTAGAVAMGNNVNAASRVPAITNIELFPVRYPTVMRIHLVPKLSLGTQLHREAALRI